MTSPNLELVRSICEAWARGDYSSADWADPDIEFVGADGTNPGKSTGLAGMAEGWRTWLNAWEDFHQEPDEYRELDDDRVLVLFRCSGRGKTSGFDLAQMHPRIAGLFHIRDGKVIRFVGHVDPERAFSDLGIEPENAGPERSY